MAEFSMMPWETQTGTGDGITDYTQDQANEFFRFFDVRDPAVEGVALGVGSQLAVTGTSSPLSVGSGSGICYGRYWNTTSKALAVATPAGGTTGGRIIMRAAWPGNSIGADGNQIRVVAKLNTDGNAAIPALTQVFGDIWEISLYTFTITTGGVITLTDARTMRKVTAAVDASALLTSNAAANNRILAHLGGGLQWSQVVHDLIAENAVEPDNILNRSRAFIARASTEHDGGDWGVPMGGTGTTTARSVFIVPSDFAGTMTVRGIFSTTGHPATDTVVIRLTVNTCLPGESVSENIATGDFIVDSIVHPTGAAGNMYQTDPLSVPAAAIGQIASALGSRLGDNVNDDLGTNIFFYGLLVEYIADS